MTLALLSVVLLASPGPTEALKGREAEIRKLLPPAGQPLSGPLRKQVEQKMVQMVDLEAMADQTLGDKAASLSPAKRKQFVDAFAIRFTKAGGEQVEAFRSNAIRYKPEVAQADGVVKVPTEAMIDNDDTEVVYVLKPDKAGWKIEDVVIDGVSTVDNFKKSFSRIIAKDGVDALIAKLKDVGADKP